MRFSGSRALYPDTPFSYFSSPLETFNVEEETTAGYVMADVGNPGDRYHINVGARIVNTKLTIDQNAASNPNPTYWGTDSWNGVLQGLLDQLASIAATPTSCRARTSCST